MARSWNFRQMTFNGISSGKTAADERQAWNTGGRKGLPHWLAPIPKSDGIKEYRLPYLGGWKPQDGLDSCERLGIDPATLRLRGPVVEIVSKKHPTSTPSAPVVPTRAPRRPVRSSTPRAPRPAAGTRSDRDALRRAYIAWLRGRVNLSPDRRYMIQGRKELRPAPWCALVRSTYPDHAAFQQAAEAWQSPRNMRTLATH